MYDEKGAEKLWSITLNGYKSAANDQLRLGRYEARFIGRLFATPENASYAVRFREQRCVNDTETQANGGLLDAANDVGR